jgi:hypothetical protein
MPEAPFMYYDILVGSTALQLGGEHTQYSHVNPPKFPKILMKSYMMKPSTNFVHFVYHALLFFYIKI